MPPRLDRVRALEAVQFDLGLGRELGGDGGGLGGGDGGGGLCCL
jgi:hypothetical protein